MISRARGKREEERESAIRGSVEDAVIWRGRKRECQTGCDDKRKLGWKKIFSEEERRKLK